MKIFKTWANKITNKTEEDLEKEFKALYDENKNVRKFDDVESKRNAIVRMQTKYRSKLRSKANIYDVGTIIGRSEINYYLMKRYNKNKEAFEEDPDGAIASGQTDDLGEPLDDRQGKKTYGEYLKDLDYQNKCVMSIYGVAKKKNTEDFFIFGMTLFDDKTKLEIPILEPVSFRAVEDGLVKNTPYKNLKAVSVTEFERIEETSEDLKIENLLKVFDAVEINDLEKWFDENHESQNMICVTRGMVGSLVLDTPPEKSYQMHLETLEVDDELVDEEGDVADATFVQVPKYMDIDFAEGSVVYVIGTAWRGFDRNNENGENKPGNIVMNALALYIQPEYKVARVETEPPAGSLPDMDKEEEKPLIAEEIKGTKVKKEDDFF